ncbi:ABC transporter permease, partial [Nocardioides sp.]|uniref:ABC transporter permease n=1 Tax=Nocardioides sp. TaxID=35761 RepID=UPI0027374F67
MSDVLVSDTPQGVPTLDISGTTAPPFHRHVGVELRKLVDTRAGKWLLIVMAVLTALVMVIQLIVGLTQDITLRYADFIAGTTYSIGFLLPILAILLLTSEWGQRTAMVTFSLEPNRVKVVLAKLAAACLVAFASVVFAIAFGGLANGLFGALSDTGASWDTSALELGAFLLVQLLAVLTGFALAALFLNTPAAIVVYFAYMFVLPGLFALGAF